MNGCSPQKSNSIFCVESPYRETSQVADHTSPSLSIFNPSPAKSNLDSFVGADFSGSKGLRHMASSPLDGTNAANPASQLTFKGDYEQRNSLQNPDTSIFSLFGPNGAEQEQQPRPIDQVMPTFNAQTLFAFGNDAISNAFADNSKGMFNQDKPHEV
jgi:hypothetical protein